MRALTHDRPRKSAGPPVGGLCEYGAYLVRHANGYAVACGGDAEGAGRGVADVVVAARDVAGRRPAAGKRRPSAEERTSRLALGVAHGVDEVVRPGREQTDMRAIDRRRRRDRPFVSLSLADAGTYMLSLLDALPICRQDADDRDDD